MRRAVAECATRATGVCDSRVRNVRLAAGLGLRRALDVRGRARRAEFWWFVLFFFGVLVAIAAMSRVVPGGWVHGVYCVLLVPVVTAAVRRLHDTGRRGAWCLLFPFVIGLVVLVTFWCERGRPHPNRFG